MTQLRVVHQFTGAAGLGADATAYAKASREFAGVVESEAFVALDGPDRIALVQLWESQQSFSTFWNDVVKNTKDGNFVFSQIGKALPVDGTEFYIQQAFIPARIWKSTEFAEVEPAIIWPANGGVRVVVQMASPDPSGARAGFEVDQELTRRESGCGEYNWMQSTEFEQDFLLLETWESQFIYDNHWNMRIKTRERAAGGADGGNPPPRAERGHGAGGIEFYRQQVFHHLYDRWLPTDPAKWSETVIWSS